MLRFVLLGLFAVFLGALTACARDTKSSCAFDGMTLSVGQAVMRDCATCVCRDDGQVYCDAVQCAVDGSAEDAAQDDASTDAAQDDAATDAAQDDASDAAEADAALDDAAPGDAAG